VALAVSVLGYAIRARLVALRGRRTDDDGVAVGHLLFIVQRLIGSGTVVFALNPVIWRGSPRQRWGMVNLVVGNGRVKAASTYAGGSPGAPHLPDWLVRC